ncbi:MAG: leucyl aminopeptidase family protein, partial [Caulobacteraceae bacterium]
MSEVLLAKAEGPAIPIHLFWSGCELPSEPAAALASFSGRAGEVVAAPGEGGKPGKVFFGMGEAARPDARAARALPASLPAGDYRLEGETAPLGAAALALAWAQGAYRFDRYRTKRGAPAPRLAVGLDEAELTQIRAVAHACALARDMINTPANDMGPRQVESIAREIAHAHDAKISVIAGDELLAEGYPAVHAVGRAASAERAPRMIEISWGEEDAPKIVVIGKGVVFD